MKYIGEYRDPIAAQRLSAAIHENTTRPWNIMEICGGQTHAILKFGIEDLLPEGIELIHGPGCPVCVTPVELIDKALAIAAVPEVIFCTFGDMMRVPGSREDLFAVKARGADVRMVYSPLDALGIARKNPKRQVVFFGVGFETTAPATAMAVYQARRFDLKNFSVLVSHVLVPPAIAAILSSAENRVQGILAAGHVCAVMGYREYQPLVERYHIPIVVTGFEPLDILHGIFMCILQLEQGESKLENQYTRVVCADGNLAARELLQTVYQVANRTWRGVGRISESGLELRKPFREFDAEEKFDVATITPEESPECIAGAILRGLKKPHQCAAFGSRCLPEKPLGAPMVSSEGACAAYYRYNRFAGKTRRSAEEKVL